VAHPVGLSTAAGRMSERELIAFLALTMSLTALGVDLLLPAFPALRAELGLPPGSTAVSGFITAYFVGLALGQVTIGPLSDRFGRRPMLATGMIIYLVGAVLAALSTTLPMLLAARLVWGIGAAGGRVLTLAIVRDRLAGAAMARTMSLISAVFIIVPVVAPSLGAFALRFVTWHQLIALNVVAALAMMLWWRRFEEPLPPERRRSLRPRDLAATAALVLRHPVTAPLVVAQAVLFGGFSSYLATSEIVFGRVFEREAAFPLIFGGIAAVLGVAALANGRLVARVGLRDMLRATMALYLVGSGLLLTLAWFTAGVPPLAAYLTVLVIVLSSHAMLIPNMTARAMEPMGHVAGTASAIVGSVLIGAGALLGSVFDRMFDDTVLPLAIAFVASGAVVALLLGVSERGATRGEPADPGVPRPRRTPERP
jgi:MFS transporter, DHA1 family, multidrug resistance protein